MARRTTLGRFNRYIKPSREPVITTPEAVARGAARKRIEEMREEARLMAMVEDVFAVHSKKLSV